MPIDYDPLKEGDQLNAASLNTRLDGARTGVNELTAADFERGAFRKDHLPSIIPNTLAGSVFEDGLSKLGPTLDDAKTTPQVYRTRINNGTTTGAYQTFNLGAPTPPYGPPAVIGDGWRIPSPLAPATGDPAEIALGVGGAGITLHPTDGYRGLLVRFSCNLIGFTSQLQMVPFLGAVSHEEDWSQCAVIGIGYTDGAGTRHVVERSVRWYSICNASGGSLETFTFINHDEVAVAPIKTVFGVIASGIMTPTTGTSGCRPELGPYNIDVLPIRSGEITSNF